MYHVQNFVSMALILFLTSPTSCAPTPRLKYKRSFKVPRLEQHNYIPDGAFALRKAYRKFGIGSLDTYPGTTFRPIIDANNRIGNSTEDDPSAPQNDVQFLSPVSVGGQMMILNFDTGSADTWVFNTALAGTNIREQTLYDPSNSPTVAEMSGSTFDISYGDGSFASGPVVMDAVDVGGTTVEQQAIGIPDNVSDSFMEDVHSNGLVGLAFSTINTIAPEKQKTFFDNVAPDLSQPVFTASLKSGEPGTYEFGNIDTNLFQGELTDVPVNTSRGFWEFECNQFAVGNDSVQTATQGSGTAIADTGTSLMLMDDEVVAAYYEQVDGAFESEEIGGVVFPCDSTLPDLQVAIGNEHMATVSGEVMNFARAGVNAGEEICFGGVQSNDEAPLQILGDVFFKSQFVAFNHGEVPSLGLAPHA